MKKWLCLAVTTLVALPVLATAGQDRDPGKNEAGAGGRSDNLKHPLGDKRAALRRRGLEMKLRGQVQREARIVEVAKGQYVELAREKVDRIFVVIAEFGNTRHSAYPDSIDGVPQSDALTFEGPLRNSIPEPDRAVDNTTLWKPDYNQAHYNDMYFNRMAKYYESQSSGRYSVDGAVTEWVKVPFNEARYGRNYCDDIVCSSTWFLLRDAMAFWVQQQLDAGWTLPQATDYLKTFDHWDRYDQDGDGNFDEPDGYIDHFQVVHAGGDEAAGDPYQGTDAIWSHRWYAQITPIGAGGPIVDGTLVAMGGIDAGGGGVSSGVTIPNNPTGIWIGDYTIQPENGGLGVFAHEYGHDLDLPDLYDTSGNTCGSACENSTGFWTLMSSGANIGNGGPDGIGDQPTDLGAWEKFQLGWLQFEVALAGRRSEHTLGPASTHTRQAEGLFVVLPDKEVVTELGAPYAGTYFYYSGSGDNLDNRMFRPFVLGAGSSLTAQVRYAIELDWDYAYVVVSIDGGANWTNVPTNLSSNTDPNGQNFGQGITGSSDGNWVTLTADLSAYTGTVLLGFRYWTDGAVVETGFMVDDLTVSGHPTDGAEGSAGWTFAPAEGGFHVSDGSESALYFNSYVAEFRRYRGYDASLRTAYNFGFLDARPNWVEHFPYQNGLLISYWDTSQFDNSTSAHPGTGLILPIDAHPAAMYRADGEVWRSRVQTFDSTFGLQRTDTIRLHFMGQLSVHHSRAAVPLFDDRRQYWNSLTPTAGVKNPHTGTQIRVKSVSALGTFMHVQVTPTR